MPSAASTDEPSLIFGGYAVAFVLVALAQVLRAAAPRALRHSPSSRSPAAPSPSGRPTERLAQRLSPAATGIVQSTLGNLPELFLAIFALQAGLSRS